MSLKKLSWWLGLTKENRVELSDLVEERAFVASKKHEPVVLSTGFLGSVPRFPSPGYSEGMMPYDAYSVHFQGDTRIVTGDGYNLFERFNVGDKALIGYKLRTERVLNYPSPDAPEKVVVSENITPILEYAHNI